MLPKVPGQDHHEFTWDSNPTRFCTVPVLAMTTASSNKKPTVLGEQSKHFIDFHPSRLAGKLGIAKSKNVTDTDTHSRRI